MSVLTFARAVDRTHCYDHHPWEGLPEPSLEGHALLGKYPSCLPIPSAQRCYALWERYDMLPHIQAHSRTVAHIATQLAQRAKERGFPVSIEAVRAAALLHDVAKTYCLRFGGSHALLGAGWVFQETGNPLIAQGVLCHVHWPWSLPVDDPTRMCSLPFFVIYADKRSRHDQCVSLQMRFEDLLVRYGHSQKARDGITASYQQAQHIERALEAHLGWQYHEYSFDCGRMVE